MKKIFTVCLIVLAVAAACIAAGCVAPDEDQSGTALTIINSDGSVVKLAAEPQRIVLLNSNAGEILYLLGSADKIIGISQSIANNAEQRRMYPDAAVVGTWNEPDVEYLVAQNADLVIGYATSKPKNAEVLASVGIPIVYIDCTKPATMASDIREVGKLAGNTARADEIAAYYDEVMNTVATAAQTVNEADKKTVYAESYTAYYAQGTDSGMGQLISLTGGKNILQETGTPKVSDEWVVVSNPEVIIKLVNTMDHPEADLRELSSRNGFDRIAAVASGDVSLIRNDITYGPRSCAAAVALLDILYPGQLPDLTAESVLAEFNSRFGTAFSTNNLIYPAL